MQPREGIRWERAAATRGALIAIARRQFAERGYHATSTPDVAAAAGVTRGALYHHFKQKDELFEAVFRVVAGELAIEAGAAVSSLSADPWRQLRAGLQAYLRLIATNPEMQRILLVDGPAVMGWARWREIQSEYTFGHLVRMFAVLMDQGVVRPQPGEPLSHLVLAALNDAAMAIAHSSDPEATRAEMGQALETLVGGLRAA